MKNYTAAFLLTFGLLSSGVCFAGFNEGMAAYNQNNYEVALKEWLPLAKHGNADAQFGMGMMYEKGQGLPRDDSQALSWYEKSAEQGHALAMERLGWMYKNGYKTKVGIIKNSHNALYYFKEASNRGLVESTLALDALPELTAFLPVLYPLGGIVISLLSRSTQSHTKSLASPVRQAVSITNRIKNMVMGYPRYFAKSRKKSGNSSRLIAGLFSLTAGAIV